MTPAARAEAAIDILQGLQSSREAADRFVKDWFSTRRFAGSKDRAAISDRVHEVLRRRASYAWRMDSEEPRALVLASLEADGMTVDDIALLCGSSSYAPAPLSDDERMRLTTPLRQPIPSWARGNFPPWLEPELVRAFGADLDEEMAALQARAGVDLRVNLIRAERDDMLVGIRALGFEAEPTPISPRGIRIPAGRGLGSLQHTSFFQTGAVEIQDESSQIAALLCEAKPGSRVLDLAAGAGGKSLALAAEMHNEGAIVAADHDERRLAQLPARARRAGATIITSFVSAEGREPEGEFDIVLVDAPCSGSGTWRRNPALKWQLTPERLGELTELQDQLLERGAQRVRPGGRLVCATCSLLKVENEDRIDAFLGRHSGFRLQPAADVWQEVRGRAGAAPGGTEMDAGFGTYFRASPRITGSDGFFAAVLIRDLASPPGPG